ncbi:hypothetical protein Psyc_1029 [Psychrobacter arcticus 273-4]|uniref:Uncharacterized protein n=1 Tax=Psychrobacter arcticus (strain DSM 17307 / VKM B-2377 / 273-4) TaxID=259536 RepID=Q4FSX6_PSYA2|nr:hypothetical protein [Psychrobacter arcticus]AAZ18882.1 hypothetical protein Psyc_1029 [Psychrobacter arcticus 273-4]
MTPEKPMIDINYVTPEQFPDNYKVWGDDGFERINNLLDKAVHLVSRKAKGEVMIYAGLSDNKSKAGKKPVVFIDCDSLNRYYIDERHIKAGKLPKPDRASAFK